MMPKLELIDGGDPVRRQAAAWFARLRADDVTAGDTRDWQRWMAADARHRAAYERFERLWADAGEHAPRPEIAARMDDAGIANDARVASASTRWRMGAGMVAALALVTAGVWQLMLPSAAPEATYVTSVGEHRDVVLKDGTRVTLDTDTQLRVTFSDDARALVLDRGRAYFRVAKERRPLSVHTEQGGLRVLGTTFEVDLRDDDVDIALVEGEVVLLPTGPTADDGALLGLVAGQKARMGGDLDAPRILAMDDVGPPAWLTGRLVFEDVSLADVVAEFNRYKHERLVIEDPGLSQLQITGVFRSDALLAFVGALCEAYPVMADATTPGVLRLRRDPSPRMTRPVADASPSAQHALRVALD